MILFKKAADLTAYVRRRQEQGLRAGFVPTMGALHAGHQSLLETAVRENDLSISSIFVNPTQFNDPSDFEKYPVTIEKDIRLLEKAGCNILFLPSVKEIYPEGTAALSHYELGYLETVLEGAYRPGHFQGVCAVVHRLLSITRPDTLYLGQKDYQQCMVIRRMTELTRLDQQVSIRICPTLRESDGLAMSSRNMRLTPEHRALAPAIFQALDLIRQQLAPGDLSSLTEQAHSFLKQKGFRTDYVEIADAENLSLIRTWDGEQKLVALAAAYLGEIRLIDNLVLN